jgi:hypothetical protein
MKKLLFILAAFPIIFATACSKEEKADTETPKVRMSYKDEDPIGSDYHQSIVDFTINGTPLKMDLQNSTEITASDNNSISFKVKKFPILMDKFPDEFYTYTGSFSRQLFTALETDYNRIDIKINNTVPTVTVNNSLVTVTGSGNNNPGTGGSPYKGIWVRQLGASGDETDLAIGTVPGEPANAVWMCEWKGTMGLYKGTISGDQITFAPQYGLPTYTVKLEGGELMLKGNVPQSLFTPYKKGTWTSHCGKLGN